MIVERLKLKNFRSYVDQEVGFAPGVTLFEGDIGSGKSSLLFALEFALFGLADVPGDHLLRVGQREGLIELEFKSGGKRFTVGRRLVRGKTGGTTQKDAYLVADGAKEDFSVEQLRAAVIKILGFREPPATKAKSQVFRYGVFTPQEEMKAILEQGAEERKQTLRRAFGIEEYKRARENADLVKQGLRERAAALEAVLLGVPRLEEERAAAARERDALTQLVSQAEGGKAQSQARRKDAEAKLRAFEVIESLERDRERELGAIAAERAKQEERRFAASRALRELDTLEPEAPPLREAAALLGPLEAEVAAAEAQDEARRSLEKALATSEARLKALEARKNEIAAESEDIRKVTDTSQETQEGKRELDAARKELDKVREQAAAAREAAVQLLAIRKRLAALEKEASAAHDLEARLKDREAAVAQGAKASRELVDLEEKLRSAQEAQVATRTNLERIEGEIEDLSGLEGKARCPKCRQPLDAAHLEEHRKELEADAKGARTRLGQSQAQARTLDKGRAGLLKLRDEGEKAGRERATIAAELKRSHQAAEEAKAVEKEADAATQAAARAEALAKEKKALERQVDAKLIFEKRAAALEVATKRWREVSDQYRKVVREVDETAKAARETRAQRDASPADPAKVKRLREQLSTARVKAAKLKDLERRLQGRGDLERHEKEAEGELADLSRRAKAAEEDRATLAAKLAASPVKVLRAAFEDAASRAAALEERLLRAQDGLRAQEEALRRAEDRLTEAASRRAELDRVRHTRDFIEQCFQIALEEIELKVLADLNAQLNARFQTYFGRLMEGAPVDVQIDAEFSPEVTQGQHALPVQALSGGERTSVALAYRLALNMLVSRAAGMETPDLLILDEPTDGFSKEQLARVGELLRDLDCQQVVLVSHERELESCADQVFEVIKDGTVSRVEAR